MARYIDADRLIAELRESAEWHEERQAGYYSAITHIKEQPTADVEPVKRGHWVEDDYGFYHCNLCNWEFDDPEDSSYTYCPSCGAKMDGGIANVGKTSGDSNG